MSQFILCKLSGSVDSTERFRKPRADEEWLSGAAQSIFGMDADLALVPKLQSEPSMLFDDAHEELINGGSFQGTELLDVLRNLAESCSAVALWWGGDWMSLPVVTSATDFLAAVERQLKDKVGDVYVLYEKQVEGPQSGSSSE